MPKEWKLKVNEDGVPELKDGVPLYLDPEGKEMALDAPVMHGKILELNKESKTRREALETAQETLNLFEGIEDITVWKKDADSAIEHVANFNDQDWLKADKVEKLKSEMKTAHADQLEAAKKAYKVEEEKLLGEIEKQKGQIRTLLISNRFATSPLFSGNEPKTTLPPELAEAYFGKHFKIEEKDGELIIVGYDRSGDQIISHQGDRVGELAEFDEAMEVIFESYPGKDRLLRAKSGSGARGGGGGDDEGVGTSADVKELEAEYKKAEEAGDVRKMVAIKNKLFETRKKVATA